MTLRESLVQALLTLLDESFPGPRGSSTWYTDAGPKAGMLATLEGISHELASTPPGAGRSTIAAHAGHLRFSLNLANRWFSGEDLYGTVDWKSSWADQEVDEAAWSRLRDALAGEYRAARQAVESGTRWPDSPDGLTGVIALIAHAAYHLGAIRQMARALTG